MTSTGQSPETALPDQVTDATSVGKPPRIQSRRRAISGLVLSQILLGLLVAVTTGMVLVQSREQAITASTHEMQSLALTLADQADRAFDAVDLLQSTFVEMTRADNIQTPEEFRRLMSTAEVNQQLIAHASMLPQLDTIGVIDADGMFINLNHAFPIPRINISDRPYFKALKADPTLTRIISDPMVARLNGSWAVVVGHRINGADGRFLGVSFGGVVMNYFKQLYQKVSNNEDTAISLFRDDSVLLARYPEIEGSIGKAFTNGSAAQRLAASGADASVTLQKSRLDGTDRVIAGHTLAHNPMMVTVSRAVSSILAPWRRQAGYLIAAAVILEAVVVGVGMLMQRQLRGQRQLVEARAAIAQSETERRADQELRVQAVRFGAALGNMSEVLCLFDAADRLVVGNDRLAAMLGLAAGSITPGMTIQDMGALLAKATEPPKTPRNIHRLIVHMRAVGGAGSQTLDTEDGRRLAVNFAPMDNEGWLVTLEDITGQRQSEARIEHMAHHDALTGLANRVMFHRRLNEAVARCRRGDRFAVLYLDLDHFKAVNDTLGHPVGDALLQEVTRRLKIQVRDVDTVARLGGDEFAIVQSIDKTANAIALAGRLIEAVSAPYEFNGNRVIIGTSIGIALVPDDGNDVDEIIKNADLALYRSKANGRGRYQFFEAEMNARMQARRTLDLDMRKALAEGEFRVLYQPLISIATRAVCGFEALVRWQHPVHGMVSPGDFIPLAEETGLIVPLGKWVLQQACADAATWPNRLKVAVNLSPVQFASETLVEDVAAAMANAALHPSRLELEITETAMLADTDAVLVTLHMLRDLGLAIALDDFGTGYSSLSYLQRFPFSKVKIDRSFVAKLGQGDNNDHGDNETIVAAVIDLCRRLRMVTTGEGVETATQLDRLAALNCVEAQGYLFSRPCPASDLIDLLKKLTPREVATIAAN